MTKSSILQLINVFIIKTENRQHVTGRIAFVRIFVKLKSTIVTCFRTCFGHKWGPSSVPDNFKLTLKLKLKQTTNT